MNAAEMNDEVVMVPETERPIPWAPPDESALPKLDVFGIDDSDKYIPPSRARYVEWTERHRETEKRLRQALADNEQLTKNTTHAQERGTGLMLRVQALGNELTMARELHVISIQDRVAKGERIAALAERVGFLEAQITLCSGSCRLKEP